MKESELVGLKIFCPPLALYEFSFCLLKQPTFTVSFLSFTYFSFSVVRQLNEHEMLIRLRLIIVISSRQTAVPALSHQSNHCFMMAKSSDPV